MIIKKIKLENIRSHLNQEINFPEGPVLLSGDIGSGKSSVLLAIEFALFGLMKGEISGEGLLRKGKNKGGIELHFNIEGKNVVIKRNLKKTSSGVVQDSGYITINDLKKEATAIELKQAILELLNYPSELLTKKSLIYRYTVYTPQEEMKNILVGDRGYRLDTLRRVFNIDKYKRIRENAKIITNKLKEKKNEYEVRISDLESKKEELKLKEKALTENKKLIEEVNKNLMGVKKTVDNKKKEIKVFEEDVNKFKEFKKELEISGIKLKNKLEKLKDSANRVGELEKEVREIKNKFSFDIKDFKFEIKNKDENLKSFESYLKETYKKLNELEVHKKHSSKVIESIISLDECPICMQKVLDEHKKKIVDKEEEKIIKLNKELEILSAKESEFEADIKKIKKELDELKKKDSEIEIVIMKKNEVRLKEELIIKLNDESILIKKEISDLETKNKELNKILSGKKIDDEKLKEMREELDGLMINERKLEIKKASFDNEIKNTEERISVLKKEISEKLKIKEKLKGVGLLKENIEERFVGLMELIEKNVMLKVHYDFDSLFRKWFEMLVDSEVIKIRLDNEFSPSIEQNGYDIDYEYLSGGEKTAAALAYRLSLNQVINNLVEGVNTKDLIILDEPTDGFSSEQLERMKNVLDELNMKQIIIVSHEDKIESFVDSVIRFEKKEHVSFCSS